ncbi:MAG: hypothetical protein LBH71_02735 [Oscillospiraceae bacterium]|jgi:hypothetical protein|nr:hypothetical protein [Oscillospiraceae bacterium]
MTDFNMSPEQIKKLKELAGSENFKKAMQIEQQIKDGNISESAIKNLTPAQAKMLKKLLSDKNAVNNFLSSDAVKTIQKKIMGDK